MPDDEVERHEPALRKFRTRMTADIAKHERSVIYVAGDAKARRSPTRSATTSATCGDSRLRRAR
jgi:hypothetical protein